MAAGMTDEYDTARDARSRNPEELSTSTPEHHGQDGFGFKDKESTPEHNSQDGHGYHDKDKFDHELALNEQVTVHEGEQKFNKLGWKALTICLIVEAIALGALSVPSAFATLGMIPGLILCIGLGLIAIYTSYVVGQVKIKYPQVEHYADAVRLIWGRPGYELCGVMFVLYLILLVGSHALTGTIAFIRIIDQPAVCALIFSVVSAIILFALALPPSFHDVSLLGYIDFVSIIAAILITMIATGIEASTAPGGLSGVEWSWWPPQDTSLYSGFLSCTNIIFAYSFAVCQFSFMSEMHTPKDYVKSIWALGLIEIFIYTITGAVIYVFVGTAVKSPALLSSSFTVSRVAFGIALPVIFISGAINGTVVGRYIMDRAFSNSSIRWVNDRKGWTVWISLIAAITIIGWLIAEAIPFFNALLGLISSLFISGFSYYFPALFWFQLIKEGKWNANRHNIVLSIANAICLMIGVATLGLGTYASVQDILNQFSSGSVRGSFTCDSSSYA